MPRYLKDTKLEVWRDQEAWQDDAGAWHSGGSYLAGTVWGNFKGTDYSEFYALHARWEEPTFKATITRPIFDVEIGDHVRYKGTFYQVKTIDDLTGKIGRDMKLTCQLDMHWEPGDEPE